MTRVGSIQMLVTVGALLAPAAALAQEAGTPVDGPETTEAAAPEAAPAAAPEGEQPVDAEAEAFLAGEETQPEIAAPEEEEGTGWEEPRDMRFWMVGARWRMLMVPRWLLDAFFDFPHEEMVDNVIINQAAGLEFTTLENNFAITGALWWAGFSSHGAFIANESGETDDPEFIESDMQFLFFTADFAYNVMFTNWIGMNFGAGLGLAVKLHGEVWRHEAYPDDDEHWGYSRCDGVNDPNVNFCEGGDDSHYDDAEDAIWPVYPWMDIIIGLRFKVFRHLEINLEGRLSLAFSFGARVNYIF
jgi:hypothetical protein